MLAYTSRPYSEAISMRPDVTCTPCATSWREKNVNTITFAHFEEGNLLSETCNDAESGDKSDDESVMPSLLSEEEINVMDSGDEYDDDLISTDMLKDICDGSKSHPSVNRREAHYKIRDNIK